MALDGGWGWVVVFSSFCCQLIADGCSFSFGVLYVELLDYFQESKSTTAWVGSLFIAVPLIMGPVASILTERYGCRVVTFVGGLIAGVGCAVSSQAHSIWSLCLSFGILAGFGLSLVFLPCVTIVTLYFDKKLGLATGIAVAGSGIGTFLFAPLTELLTKWYGWRGAILIIGGIMLHLCVFAMVFIHPPAPPPEEDEGQKIVIIKKTSVLDLSSIGLNEKEDKYSNTKISANHEQQTLEFNEPNHCEDEMLNIKYNKEIEAQKDSQVRNTQKSNCCAKFRTSEYFKVAKEPVLIIFCTSIFFLYLTYDTPYIFTPDKAVNMGISEAKASFLVSLIGITSTFGQIGVGIIGDSPRINAVYIYIIFTIIAGIITALVPFYHNYALLCMFCASYGVFISANYTLVSVILVQYLGARAFATAYGLEMMAEGLANLIGPPFGGWLNDLTGSYDLSFISNGTIMVISGAMPFVLLCFERKSTEISKESNGDVTNRTV